MKKKLFKMIAHTLLLSFGYQLVFPAYAYALTTGPSQPEVQSFEPVGTTEMVDMFSGDFNYNIPLMDVEGYPVNIFYHSGVGMEQEASWVGLGWNINPGEINRTVRGLPDDFGGEMIEKRMHIKEEKDVKVGMGTDGALEVLGKELGLNLSLGAYINQNNYRGLSAGLNSSVGLSCPVGSIGIGLGIGTQTGADIDMYAALKTPDIVGKSSLGVSVNGGVGYNSRSGLKDISLGMNLNASIEKNANAHGAKGNARGNMGTGVSTAIPIGLQNYVPVVTNAMHQNSFQAQLKVGVNSGPVSAFAYVDIMKSKITYDEDASRRAYGYLYLNAANKEDILDFSREKDGVYNKTLKNLPASGMTYDLYSINGHGTGGMFRPFRNDIGTISDPFVRPAVSKDRSMQIEAAVGAYGQVGDDVTWISTMNESGSWIDLGFSSKTKGSLFENVFFKQAGELTYNQQQEASQLFNNKAQYLDESADGRSIAKVSPNAAALPAAYQGGRIFWDNQTIDRSSRATNISWQTAEEIMQIPEMDQSKQIISYNDAVNFYDPTLVKYNRYARPGTAGLNHNAKSHHISEFTQTAPDGRRYVYGIPAMNNATREVTLAVDESSADLNTGYVTYTAMQNSVENNTGRDGFYSSTVTPAYAHSYLLTALLSADYVDVLGDGPTDDDLGTFVKYNYTLKDNDYRWRTPYPANTAQYNPGFWSDNQDGKGNYMVGSRQQWNLRSIETKNYVAEFRTSARLDGKGVKDAVLNGSTDLANASESYQLDSIQLFNKHDRYINQANAIPVKTVVFDYTYDLCKGVPNAFGPGVPAGTAGKLTLRKILIRYGNSQKNLLSPYVFEYNGYNPRYDFAAKDRWGNYKKVVPGVHNYEFPYTEQPDGGAVSEHNRDLASWNLTDIKLPSGGKIHVDYESDDYSFVQDKRSMQMLKIEGVGSTKKMVAQDRLFHDKDNINDYVYFKRRISRENTSLSLKDNYLEGQDLLYYSFALDITATGKYEHINGYAKIDEVGYCDNNPASEFGYIKLKRESAQGLSLHPAALLGMNTGRYYLPHIFYEGYSSGDVFGLADQLAKKLPELLRTMLGVNPFKDFVGKNKAARLAIENSWIRVQTPGLTKKGGGIRVKQLILSDNWNNLAGNEASQYGKKYDYTVSHPRYGTVSSGVASYEPMIGADENPFRMPVPYSADKGRGIPSADFFQEEPFGESFFPGASVGYSSIKVSSIHEQYGRSAQALDEYLFYTAKDYPVKVSYTEKKSAQNLERTLDKQNDEAKALQGYCIQLNDMHGKARAVNNYVVRKNGSNMHHELITGIKYLYKEDAQQQLNNKVRALVRKRGTQNNFEIKDVFLGQDMDFTVDSRYRRTNTTVNKTKFNLNIINFGLIPVPIFTLFRTNKETDRQFKSLVSTKIIQQYGILKSIETTDHQAKTTTENLVYDAETGAVLLSATSNEFNQYTANLIHPAYLAYEGMRPAYTNDGYEEKADSLVINDYREGFLYTDHFDRFTDGDELLVTGVMNSGSFKLWVIGTGTDTAKPVYPPLPDSGTVSFTKRVQLKRSDVPVQTPELCPEFASEVAVNLRGVGPGLDDVFNSGILKKNFRYESAVPGDELLYRLPVGVYNFKGTISDYPYSTESGVFTVVKDHQVDIVFGSRNVPDCDGITVNKPKEIPPAIIDVPVDDGAPRQLRCALKVAPRYKDRFVGAENKSTWPALNHRKRLANVSVRVIRSGRRNNLDQNVQQTTFSSSGLPAPTSSLPDLFRKITDLVNVSVRTFTDTAQIYTPFADEMMIGAEKFGLFNPFVLGIRGNFRPLSTYAPVAQRNYSKVHTRYDGTYIMSAGEQFWSLANATAIPAAQCDGKTDLFVPNMLTGTQFWKMVSRVTRYDVFGNALEERDAIGNYSSAQYGYNKALPVSVASNAGYQQFMFDGFEDYTMLVPEKIAALFLKGDLYTAFGALLGTTPDAPFSRYGQNFQTRNTTPPGSLQLTGAVNHTGFYSLKSTAAVPFVFTVGNAETQKIGAFKLAPGKKYLLQLWARNHTPAGGFTGTPFKTKINTGADIDMKLKTNGIDNWYQFETTIDLTATLSGTVTLSIPPNVYVDDIRAMPVTANMKSFVYDPLTFRLLAQLDENHMATFFEYDQEGILVRTKKETEKGIVTISESRKANSKQN